MMLRAKEIRALPNYRDPVPGEDICVPTSLYLSRGADDFMGGLCQIAKVIRNDDCPNEYNRLFVTIVERPGHQYNWLPLIEGESKNLETYGDRRGYPDPDLDPQFNTGW